MKIPLSTVLTIVAMAVAVAVTYGRLDGRVAALEKAATYYHGSVKVPE